MDDCTIFITGNMAKDPERSPNCKGNNFATFEVIHNSSKYNKEIGQHVKTPYLHTVSVKNQAADYIMRYGGKGKRVTVKGELKYKDEILGGIVSSRPYIEATNVDITRHPFDEFTEQLPSSMLDKFIEMLRAMFSVGVTESMMDKVIKLFNKKLG